LKVAVAWIIKKDEFVYWFKFGSKISRNYAPDLPVKAKFKRSKFGLPANLPRKAKF